MKKKILITGASGFLGNALVPRVKELYPEHEIYALSRNEGKLIALKQKYPYVKIITGDVGDECTVEMAVSRVEILLHLSGFKHVGLAESLSYQCTMTNIVGTINLLKHFHGSLFVAISTDKAAQLQGVYGASKRIMEKLIEERAKITKDVRYIPVRYGNVIGSTGSVVPKWIDICKNGGEMILTDPDATRFFFTVEDAVDLIFEAIKKGESGRPYIKPMKSCDIRSLWNAVARKYGQPNSVKVIGLQPGENEHEYLSADYCSKDAEKFTIDELIKMV